MADFDNVQVFIGLASLWLMLIFIKCVKVKKLPDNNIFHKSIIVTLAAYSTYGVLRLTMFVLGQESNFADDLIAPMFLAVAFSLVSCFMTLRDLFTK